MQERTKDNLNESSSFYKAAWRWHFYAGLFVSPFLIILACTGIIMMYITHFDGRDGEKVTINVPSNIKQISLEIQASNASSLHVNSKVIELIKAPAEDKVNIFRVKKEDKSQDMVAINPYTGQIVNNWKRREGLYDLADDIHSDLLLGEKGDRVLEIAAGFSIVLLFTGMYLWWPRNKKFSLPLLPNFSLKGREFFKNLHMSIGMYTSIFFLLFLLSGMAWTGIWGSKLVQAWSSFPEEKWDNVPLSKKTHGSLNNTNVEGIPWAIEKTLLPASGSQMGVEGTLKNELVNLESIKNLANRIGFEGRYRISFPKGPEGVWTINQDTMSGDAKNPFADKTVHVDRYTGKVLAKVEFSDYSLAGKTMAVSIPLHMGLVTTWNLVINTFVCLAVIFMSLTGLVMWWKRRPSNAGFRLCAPSAPVQLPHWHNAMIIMLVLSLAFPLVGLSLISVLLLDVLIISKIPGLKKIFT